MSDQPTGDRERVALDLAIIIDKEEGTKKSRHDWLTLYNQCLKAVYYRESADKAMSSD